MGKNNLLHSIKQISSVTTLIFANLITIVWASIYGWNFATILYIYWLQSVIIGYFQFKKIMGLEKFSTTGFSDGSNRYPVPETKEVKIETARFFALHYGLFHLFYIFALAQTENNILWFSVITSGLIFFANHLFSYKKNEERDSKKIKNIGFMMFFPYARVIPMQAIIATGFFLSKSLPALILFMCLKTIADVFMHLLEHKA